MIVVVEVVGCNGCGVASLEKWAAVAAATAAAVTSLMVAEVMLAMLERSAEVTVGKVRAGGRPALIAVRPGLRPEVRALFRWLLLSFTGVADSVLTAADADETAARSAAADWCAARA